MGLSPGAESSHLESGVVHTIFQHMNTNAAEARPTLSLNEYINTFMHSQKEVKSFKACILSVKFINPNIHHPFVQVKFGSTLHCN